MTEDTLSDVVTGIDREKRKEYLERQIGWGNALIKGGTLLSPKARDVFEGWQAEYKRLLEEGNEDKTITP